MGLARSQPGVRRISQNIPYRIAKPPALPRLSPPTSHPHPCPGQATGRGQMPWHSSLLPPCTTLGRGLHLPQDPPCTSPMGQDGAQSLHTWDTVRGLDLHPPNLLPTGSVPPASQPGTPRLWQGWGAGVEPTPLLGEAGEEPREEEEEQLLCLHLGAWELLCQPCSIALISPAPPFLNEQLIGAV